MPATLLHHGNTTMHTNRAGSLVWIAVACLLAAGCGPLDSIWGKTLRPEFCKDHPADTECRQAFPDGGEDVCVSNGSCAAPTAVCDVLGSQMCVQCIAPDQTSACSGTTPACGADHACHACSKHDDCPLSSACLPDGSCAPTEQVAYVDAVVGAGSACTQAVPCKKVSDALGTRRPYVKLSGTVAEAVQINNQNITIISAPGAKLTRTDPGVILRVDGTSVVQITDLTIADGLGGTGIGISLPAGNTASLDLLRVTIANNAGIGILASGGTLKLSRSTISGNTGGGISLSGSQFDITNCFIFGNGGSASGLGGVDISQVLAAGTHRLDFNTIASNLGKIDIPVNTGISCSTIGVPLVFDSNIVYGNAVNGGGQQIGGSAMCSATYSDVGPDPTAGATNINVAPMFRDPARNDFHLTATSPTRDAANPAATISDDFDGDPRPQGARRDIGADEVR